MRQVVSPIHIVQKILGAQKTADGIPYRLSAHCMRVEQPEGVLLYHTLTGELVLLSAEEAAALESLPGPVPPALGELAARRFLVPQGAEEMALAAQTRDIARRLTVKNDGVLTDYLVFLTTACNARCFYCFEAGIRTAVMTEQTARAAGEYMADHCGGRTVYPVWFGGEPLTNVPAIDAISDTLRRRGVRFRSRMDTNGYLFDETLAARAKEDWHLRQVQITLDGTEAVYNARKAYVHPAGSPFQRVLRNMGLLLDAGIRVGVRLNLDGENEQDLYALIDQLADRFGGRPGFYIYIRALVENKGVGPVRYTEEERNALADKVRAMWACLDGKGLALKTSLGRRPVLHSCWANDALGATITPEGHLGRCESHIDAGLWGSVFSAERDEDVLRQWRERRPPQEACGTCALYPQCTRLKRCVIHPARCSPVERAEMEIRRNRAMAATYERWKAAHPEEI